MAGSPSEYEVWREEHHARKPATDHALLADVVRDATGASAASWTRLVRGEVNEVYVVTMSSGDDVIVRVSRDERKRFHSERWVLDAARAVGVAVPDVLLVAEREDGHGPLLVCVESRVAGRALCDVEDAATRERIAMLAGEATARLHGIAIDGFGAVRVDGTAPAASWARVMQPWMSDAHAAAVEQHADAAAIPRSWLAAASRELERHAADFASVESQLLHGDLSSAHVMTDGVRVTGIIDFEQAFAGDPTFEFVRWNYFYEDSPLEWLIAGYERHSDLGADVDLRIKLGRLRLHLALIEFYGVNTHPTASVKVRRHFAEDAEWFGFPAT